jgi:hypothetical protein
MEELGQEHDQDMAGDHVRVVIVRFPELLSSGHSETISLASPTNDGFEGGSSRGRTLVFLTRSILHSREFSVEVVDKNEHCRRLSHEGLLQSCNI